MDTLRDETRVARKRHVCSFCGCAIEKGEKYRHEVNVFDGRPYTWKSHKHCEALCSAIWNFVGPDEGMTDYDFQDGVEEVMHEFYCPVACDKWDRKDEDCTQGLDRNRCLRAFAKFMETHELVREKAASGIPRWRMVERKPNDKEA